jgi:uncharacterized protein
MQIPQNVVGWFEIPVTDMVRAMAFYSQVFGYSLERHTFPGIDMAWFPFNDGPGAPGSLVCQPQEYQPSSLGTLVYFTSPSGDLAHELARVAPAGGTVLQEKTLISEDIGYMGLFMDTEGNRVALHSKN